MITMKDMAKVMGEQLISWDGFVFPVTWRHHDLSTQ